MASSSLLLRKRGQPSTRGPGEHRPLRSCRCVGSGRRAAPAGVPGPGDRGRVSGPECGSPGKERRFRSRFLRAVSHPGNWLTPQGVGGRKTPKSKHQIQKSNVRFKRTGPWTGFSWQVDQVPGSGAAAPSWGPGEGGAHTCDPEEG